MIWAALVVAAAAVGASWVYNNVLLVAQRLHATRNMPDPMEGHWLLGHIPALLAKPLCSFRLFRAWAERYGPIYRVRFLGRPVSCHLHLEWQPNALVLKHMLVQVYLYLVLLVYVLDVTV